MRGLLGCLLALAIVLLLPLFVTQKQLARVDSSARMNAIVLEDPVVLVSFQCQQAGANASNAESRNVNKILATTVASALPANWSFIAPLGIDIPGKLTFRHLPSNRTWKCIVQLESDTLNEPGNLSWVIRYVQAAGYADAGYREANFKWAWDDLGPVFDSAIVTGTNALYQLGWIVFL